MSLYCERGERSLLAFRTIRAARLLELSVATVENILEHPDISERDRRYLRLWIQKAANGSLAVNIGIPIEFITHNYPSFTGVEESNLAYGYLNRLIVEIICRLGLDGWVVRPYCSETGCGMKRKVVEQIVDYLPEIMLCSWANHLILIRDAEKSPTIEKRRSTIKVRNFLSSARRTSIKRKHSHKRRYTR